MYGHFRKRKATTTQYKILFELFVLQTLQHTFHVCTLPNPLEWLINTCNIQIITKCNKSTLLLAVTVVRNAPPRCPFSSLLIISPPSVRCCGLCACPTTFCLNTTIYYCFWFDGVEVCKIRVVVGCCFKLRSFTLSSFTLVDSCLQQIRKDYCPLKSRQSRSLLLQQHHPLPLLVDVVSGGEIHMDKNY